MKLYKTFHIITFGFVSFYLQLYKLCSFVLKLLFKYINRLYNFKDFSFISMYSYFCKKIQLYLI
jgi:hypothetical protein